MIETNMIKKPALLLSLLLVLGVVLVTPRYLDLVEACGHFIPQENLPADYLKGLLWALALLLGILFWPVPAASKRLLLVGWLAKVAVTLGAMLFYENNYGLDAYMYFDESTRKSVSLAQFTLTGNDAGTMNIVNLASLFNLLVPDSFHAQKICFSMLGLIGVYLHYRSAEILLGRKDPRIFYLLALFPGILFWSSTLGKEPVVLLGIALYVHGVTRWYKQKSHLGFLLVALGVYLCVLIRVWLGPILVLPLVLLFLRVSRGTLTKFVLVFGTCLVLVVSAGPMLERFKIQAIEDVFTAADKTTKGFVTTEGGSTQNLQVDLTSVGGVLKFLPQAAFTALFRPLPGEVMNPFGLLAGVESSILLVLLLLAIKRTRLAELTEPLTLWAVCFVVLWALVNGIVSSANFGVAVRYKLQILPVLLGLLGYLSRRRTVRAAVKAAVKAAGDTPALRPATGR